MRRRGTNEHDSDQRAADPVYWADGADGEGDMRIHRLTEKDDGEPEVRHTFYFQDENSNDVSVKHEEGSDFIHVMNIQGDFILDRQNSAHVDFVELLAAWFKSGEFTGVTPKRIFDDKNLLPPVEVIRSVYQRNIEERKALDVLLSAYNPWPSITDAGCSARLGNICDREGIITVKDLASKTEKELLSFRNCGETVIREINHLLSKHDLRLGMRFDP